jgi:hypothetical protein
MNPKDPVRLLDDPSVPAELRADLASAVRTPPEYLDMQAGLLRLTAAIAAGSAATAAKAAGTAGALGAKSWSVGKLLLWGVSSLGVAGAIAIGTANLRAPAATSKPSTPAATAATAPRRAALPVAVPHEDAGSAQNDREGARTVPQVPARRAPRAGPTARSNTESRTAREPSAEEANAAEALLAEETAHLARLRALARSNPAAALALADEGAQRFAGGVFAHEREAIAIQALVALGQTTRARARASRFLSAFPKSPYRERLKRATGLNRPDTR